MSVNTPASGSAHDLRTRLGMPSGPEALQELRHVIVFMRSVPEAAHYMAVSRTQMKLCPGLRSLVNREAL
jgi:hypothetical protein